MIKDSRKKDLGWCGILPFIPEQSDHNSGLRLSLLRDASIDFDGMNFIKISWIKQSYNQERKVSQQPRKFYQGSPYSCICFVFIELGINLLSLDRKRVKFSKIDKYCSKNNNVCHFFRQQFSFQNPILNIYNNLQRCQFGIIFALIYSGQLLTELVILHSSSFLQGGQGECPIPLTYFWPNFHLSYSDANLFLKIEPKEKSSKRGEVFKFPAPDLERNEERKINKNKNVKVIRVCHPRVDFGILACYK